jgi:RNA recognition motif-containing protein
MGNKLFISNMAFSVTDSALSGVFAQFGSVNSAQVVMDKQSGRSRGFGFVEMSSDEEAQAAITSLNGTEVEGRQISVALSVPRERDSRPAPRRNY